MNTKVFYVSSTGNTAKIAQELFRALPSSNKDIERLEHAMGKYDADCYFLGFWANRGTANVEVLDFISGLHHKKVAFFGTCGMGNDPAYYSQIEHQVLAFLPEDNEFFGSFFCQGKMPMQVRQKYEQMLKGSHSQAAEKFIQNFDHALFHPSSEDVLKAAQFAKDTYTKMTAGYLEQLV